MQAHVPKPIDLTLLIETIAKVTGRGELAMKPMEVLDEKDNDLEQFKTIQATKALKNMGGNITIYNKVLKRFSEEYQSFEENLKDLVNNGSLQDGVRFFHTFKRISW